MLGSSVSARSTGRRGGHAGRREEGKVKESTAPVGGVRASKGEVVFIRTNGCYQLIG